jgi:HAMP domain-containing protein
MEARGTFVVEVVGALREGSELATSRVAEALSLSDDKARALVARMPGIITRPMSETRAAKVALRLQAVGIAAVHRPERVGQSPDGAHAARRAVERAAADELLRLDVLEALTPLPEAPAYVPPAPVGADGSMLAQVPSVDATLIEDRDVREHTLTPMSEAGFGAADIMVPTQPRTEWPAPRERRFTTPIVEGAAPSAPERAFEAADATMIRPAHAEPEGAAPPVSPPRRSLRSTPPRQASAASAAGAASGSGATPSASASARARDAIARDRAVDGRADAEPPRPPAFPEDDLELTPRPERSYRAARSSGEAPISLSAPPDDLLKRSGVREDALSAARVRRRGAFGRRLSTATILASVSAWGIGAWFVWLLLPGALRAELWIPLVAATAVATVIGALVHELGIGRVVRDVIRLRDASERVSMGDLAKPVELQRRDELGDVAEAVERMRLSLQESLERLRRRQR